MVAVMALMEAPSIIIGVLLMALFAKEQPSQVSSTKILKHSVAKGSVLSIMSSLFIGFMTNEAHNERVVPFTAGVFKGILPDSNVINK